jgi:hypothetical protein
MVIHRESQLHVYAYTTSITAIIIWYGAKLLTQIYTKGRGHTRMLEREAPTSLISRVTPKNETQLDCG